LDTAPDLGNLVGEGREWDAQHGRARDQHDVDLSPDRRRRIRGEEAETGRLAEPAAGAVARDRTADASAGRDSDPRRLRVSRCGEGDQRTPGEEATILQQAIEVTATDNSKAALQLSERTSISIARRVVDASGQALAALAPPIPDHARAAARAHAR
jgi:hypothetical protein